MKKLLKITIILVLNLILFNACTTDNLDPTLAQDKAVEGNVTNMNNLYSILKGSHSILTGSGYYGRDIIATNEVRSDNCFSNGNSGRFSTQAEYQYNNNTGFMWDDAYRLIANANVIINTDLATLEGDQDYGKHVQGQALVLRALAHFDLLRVYGQQHSSGGSLGVPVVTTFKGEDLFPARNSYSEVITAIYADIETAFGMMNSSFDTDKVLVSKFAAKALESRVAVYNSDWTRAKNAAEAVINSDFYSIADADSFVSNFAGKEASNSIFELALSTSDNPGINGLSYIYRYPGDEPSGYGDIQVNSDVIDIFEDGDVRKDILGYQDGGTALRNMGKYPDQVNNADNIPLMRYEEVILNYAEALFELNGGAGEALTQINLITSNRGASAYVGSITKDDILNERRKELMFEGFRFDDLMRTAVDIDVVGSIEQVIETLSYPNDLFAWPIPKSETDANSNMVQNNGY